MIAPAIKIEDDVDLSRSYVEGEEVDFDEDVTHEFKGHRNLGYEEMPNFVKYDNSGRPTRQPLSKAICSFLNSVFGGVIYCGVTDEGKVKGLLMLRCQRQHFRLAVEDLLSNRFTPPVPKERYHLKFVPMQSHVDNPLLLAEQDPLMEHEFRTSLYCKCDKAAEMLASGREHLPKVVMEIHIEPPPEVKENQILARGT